MEEQYTPTEHEKWLFEHKRREAERSHDTAQKIHASALDAALQSAHNAIRGAMVINGGAAIAVLGFLGSLSSRIELSQVPQLVFTIVWFAGGVAAAGFAMGIAYIVTYSAARSLGARDRVWEPPYERETEKSKRWRWATAGFQGIAVMLVIGSLVAFVAGMLAVRHGLDAVPKAPTAVQVIPAK